MVTGEGGYLMSTEKTQSRSRFTEEKNAAVFVLEFAVHMYGFSGSLHQGLPVRKLSGSNCVVRAEP